VFGPAAEAWAVGRRVHAGTVKLNAITLFALSQSAPRPAWGLSGLVDEGTVETFEFFRGTRVIGAGAEVK
jgi:phenylacetaldehyde dehydrogenase